MKHTWMATIAGLLLSGGVALAHGEHRDLKLRDLPRPVQASIRAEAKFNPVEDIHETTDASGRKVYEAEIKAGHRETNLTILPDGAIIDRRVHRDDDDAGD